MSIVSSFSLKSTTYTEASKNNTLDANREFLLKFISSDLLNKLDRFAESDKFDSSLYEVREFFISQKSPFQRNPDVVEVIVQRYLQKGTLFKLFDAIASNGDPKDYLSALEKMFSSNAFQNASLDLSKNQVNDWSHCIKMIVYYGGFLIQNKLKVFDLIFNHSSFLFLDLSDRLDYAHKIFYDLFNATEKPVFKTFEKFIDSLGMKDIRVSSFLNMMTLWFVSLEIFYTVESNNVFFDQLFNLFDFEKEEVKAFSQLKSDLSNVLEMQVDPIKNSSQLQIIEEKALRIESEAFEFLQKNRFDLVLKNENTLLDIEGKFRFQLLSFQNKIKDLNFGALSKDEGLKKEFFDLFYLFNLVVKI